MGVVKIKEQIKTFPHFGELYLYRFVKLCWQSKLKSGHIRHLFFCVCATALPRPSYIPRGKIHCILVVTIVKPSAVVVFKACLNKTGCSNGEALIPVQTRAGSLKGPAFYRGAQVNQINT